MKILSWEDGMPVECGVDMGFGRSCARPAVVKVYDHGMFKTARCRLHNNLWTDAKGQLHDAVWFGNNMIPDDMIEAAENK